MLNCACVDEDVGGGIWTLDDILHFQKISDLLIALAYFSIPLELFYFVSCSTVFPFRWILTQFGAFIVLCGLTHFVTVWTYDPHSFQLMLTLTVLKFLTALVSCATSITFVTLIPQLLKVMVREGLLMKKTRELDREVILMKRKEEASWHVRMLTREIRNLLDRHTILYTTLVELSKVLFLENCAIWMPDEVNSVMNLTHELKRSEDFVSIPMDDPEVIEIVEESGVRVLGFDSRLRRLAGRGSGVAIRLPMLRVSSFKGGTPEIVEECYAILILVLPAEGNRSWNSHELEIVEVVADQVAVALSHAAVIEESMLFKEQLMEQNMALEKARRMALMANEARCSFQKVMSREMIAPARSVAAIVSVLQLENLKSEEQRRMVDTMAKGSLLISALIEDATGVSGLGDSRLELKSRNFSLHSMLKEAAGVSKLLCGCRKLNFDIRVYEKVPDRVIGDETRILQAVLYMVGKASRLGERGTVILSVYIDNGLQGILDPKYFAWKQNASEDFAYLRFEVGRMDLREDGSSLLEQKDDENFGDAAGGQGPQGLKFNICEKLAELMHGSVSVVPTTQGVDTTMNLTIRLQLQRSEGGLVKSRCMDPETARCLLKGMNTLLIDRDSFNQSITRKLMEKLGCHFAVVTSWHQCLESLHRDGNNYHLLLVDLGMLEEEGLQVFDMIRKLRLENWLLVIALALKSDGGTRDRCLQNGINGVICKPIILQEMEDELQRIFQHAARTHSPPFYSETED
ncbi:Signal transduction response regulator [Macleaya cordata]|uniref:Ethylene receptor n=1 Tax=Macleaya cordata TaxID=56857 RepID=A0A200QYN4_MACCD|nr:Signal transduction response regulator [Macleaya cordata]